MHSRKQQAASRKQPAEILQDMAFHHRLWAVQRVGWIVALLIIALALGGLFGSGPLSSVQAGDAALTVEYDRFVRRDSPTEIRIDAQPSAENEVRIAFTRDYVHEMRVDSILPYPQRVETVAEEVLFVFRVAPQTPSARITINAMPLHVGSLQGRVRIVGDANAPSIPLDQFVWP
jgi:hypothetical protein